MCPNQKVWADRLAWDGQGPEPAGIQAFTAKQLEKNLPHVRKCLQTKEYGCGQVSIFKGRYCPACVVLREDILREKAVSKARRAQEKTSKVAARKPVQRNTKASKAMLQEEQPQQQEQQERENQEQPQQQEQQERENQVDLASVARTSKRSGKGAKRARSPSVAHNKRPRRAAARTAADRAVAQQLQEQLYTNGTVSESESEQVDSEADIENESESESESESDTDHDSD